MIKKLKWIAVVAMCVVSPAMAEDLSEFHQHFADTIGTAHGIKAYRPHAALQADLTVTFDGNVMLQGVMTFDTPVGQSRIETEDGTVMVFDGEDAWITPADAPVPPGMSRFHLLTWPYFVAAPFKLADPGTTTAVMYMSMPKYGKAVPRKNGSLPSFHEAGSRKYAAVVEIIAPSDTAAMMLPDLARPFGW